MVFACDLDNTLVYSHKMLPVGGVLVETYEGREITFMTAQACHRLASLKDKLVFVPVTTRSVAQYRRLFLGLGNHMALADNGGNLLVNGQIDETWLGETKRLIESGAAVLRDARRILGEMASIEREPELVDELFIFTKANHCELAMERLENRLDLDRVFIGRHGNKLYVFPKKLDKGAALLRLRERLGKERFYMAAGDSPFDIPMLKAADLAFAPAALGENKGMEKRGICLFSGEPVRFGDRVLAIAGDIVDGRETPDCFKGKTICFPK